ncbi:MAG: hypothetical protein DRJ05_15360, partial [Bacteroidetes bacterium]
VRDIGNPSFTHTIELENEGGSGYYKMGKMLYINDQGNTPDIHKILVFPLRFFANTDDDVPTPGFYVIDGNNYTDLDFVNYNEQVIRDATYLKEHEDLILGFAPKTNGSADNESMAVFSYNQDPENENEYIFEYVDELPADNSTITSAYDLNVALGLTRINGTSALVSNKDGIGILEYDAAEDDYDYTNTLNAESNFFRKGVITESDTNAKVFIPNTVANGMEVYNIGNSTFDNIRTGYPVYQITANEDGNNMFFYHKLNAHQLGLYAHNPEAGSTTHIDIETAIGDVVYNPYQDHFLVTKFEPGDAQIKVYNADDNTIPEPDDVTPPQLADAEFAKEMFITPGGELIVCANMHNSSVSNPTIFRFDATDYTLIDSYTVNPFLPFEDNDDNPKPFAYYKASFDYNEVNESVYISMAIQDLQKQPYNSQASTIYNIVDPTDPETPPPGKLIVAGSTYDEVDLANFPGTILCPSNISGKPSQFKNKLFIAGAQFYMYDYEVEPLPENESGFILENEYFLDMVYSPYHDRIFAVRENIVGNCSEHRTFEIVAIDYNETISFTPLEFSNPEPFHGQIASIFYNPYDRRIYVYQKIDAQKVGNSQVRLLSFDPEDEDPGWSITQLGIKSYFPSYDHSSNPAQYYFYNITTPYINPNTNHIYVPNGGHSCVSKVPFVAAEPLQLTTDEWTWLSFPRMNRQGNNTVPVDDILGNDNIEPNNYKEGSKLVNRPLESTNDIYNEFNGYYWDGSEGDLTDIQSNLGYKLKLLYEDPQPEESWVFLKGTVLDPNTTFELFTDKENWIGYYLYQEQDVFDALEYYIEDIESIRHQDYYCYRPHGGDIIFGPTGGGVSPPTGPEWACNNSIHNIKYGDMVIVHPNKGIDEFSWISSGDGGGENTTSRPEPTYFTYEETADYKPLIIELDSTENPEEIGAFVGENCVGACSVIAEDTAVILLAYLDGLPADSVVFQEYSSTKSSSDQIIDSYLVLDEIKGLFKKRSISTKEGNGKVFISFKETKPMDVKNIGLSFNIWPNPASTILNCLVELEQAKQVTIQLMDITGKPVAYFMNEQIAAGNHHFQFELKDSSGNPLKPGIYLVQCKIDVRLETKKLIVK